MSSQATNFSLIATIMKGIAREDLSRFLCFASDGFVERTIGGLGAHEKLTTCARIELTTPKTGFATWQALENRAIIRAAGA